MQLWLVLGVVAAAAVAATGAFGITGSDTITTFAGNGTIGSAGDGGPATSAQVSGPRGLAVDGKGNVYISDTYRVRRVSPRGAITTFLESPSWAPGRDNMWGLAVDGKGSVYFADPVHERVRKVRKGRITTIAGTGSPGFSGDGGPATKARLYDPLAVAVDTVGNVYIADAGNNRVREVSKGKISTIAGSGPAGLGPAGYSGASGPATSAQLNRPGAVAVDRKGNVYIADGPRIRAVSSRGWITTFAGMQTTTDPGDGGRATAAFLGGTTGLAVDGEGNVYIATTFSVRKVDSRGTITTIAGTGKPGFSGDGGPAISARLNGPLGLAVDGRGNLYIADNLNNRVRRVAKATP